MLNVEMQTYTYIGSTIVQIYYTILADIVRHTKMTTPHFQVFLDVINSTIKCLLNSLKRSGCLSSTRGLLRSKNCLGVSGHEI